MIKGVLVEGGNRERTAGGGRRVGGIRGSLSDGAVGDQVKERPAELLECAAVFLQRGGALFFFSFLKGRWRVMSAEVVWVLSFAYAGAL